ncbi:hypothetical protein V8C35DRAFT_331223 [Trichoderma chlorosporum]
MGTPQGKKATPKKGQTAAHDRRSPSKALKAQQTPKLDKSKTPTSTPRETAYTHNLPTNEQKKGNGRVTGRSLIMWNRPRMTEKLLLHLHFECIRHKVNIPWDTIAHRLRPGSSGQAVLQHVNRLRKELLSEGHMVPPPAHKSSPSTPYDPAIRGYVRDPTSDDKHAIRVVGFDEKLDDAKINLPDAFDALEEDDDDFLAEPTGEVFTEDNADFTTLEEEIELPATPTPVRHAAPRGSVSGSQYRMQPQSLQPEAGLATQQLFDSSLFAGISPPNFVLNSIEELQPMGIQNPTTFANEAHLVLGGGSLFDPFVPQPLIKPTHEQISPGGQVPLVQFQQPFFLGNPLNAQFTGYYNLVQPNFMPHPPYGFAMPPTPPAAFNVEAKHEAVSPPAAIQDRGISVSPVSSPIAAQLPALQPEVFQPVVESPELQFDEISDLHPYSGEFVGHDLLLEFLASE